VQIHCFRALLKLCSHNIISLFSRDIEDRGQELEPNVSTTDMNSPSVKERESPGHGSCSDERYKILLLNLFIFYFNNSSMDNCRCSASEPC
jgi:hypothetical protein